MPHDPSIDNRPVQWRDLSGSQRRVVSDNIRETGLNLPQHAQAAVETMSRSGKSTPGKVRTAQGVADSVTSKPVSLQSAANRRQELYNRGIEDRAAANPDDPHQVIPTGAGWYFDHHRAIADSAIRSGYDHDRAIAASGVMSPQNSPENERAAVSAIMDAHANHSVTITPEVTKHLAGRGIDVSAHEGKRVPFRDLPTGATAHLSDSKIRGSLDTDANLVNVARGGTRENIVKAERVLSGEVHPDEAVNPHSAPKVWSYVHNTRAAVPGSPTHVEFMGRVHQDALVRRGQISPDQQALDLYGHGQQSGSHLLSPESHTVEDTWQNAITFDQPKTFVPQSKTSVFKAAGSLPSTYPVARVKTRQVETPAGPAGEKAHTDARVGNAGLTHAFNNRATQKAAEQQGKASGVTVPPAAVQEVAWVQVRKDAGKDPEFNQAQRSAPKVQEDTGQPTLPGMEGLFHDRR